MITGLNHITLAVAELNRSLAFYRDLLGFSVRMHGTSSAYLEAGDLWLALVEDATVRCAPLPEYTHLALSVYEPGFLSATEKLRQAGVKCWQSSERANSFYFLDPDGHKLELHSGNLSRRLNERGIMKADAEQKWISESGEHALIPNQSAGALGL
jgi:catechol 2,3-dioxygenase-like lactoylglutathione lyase family enzyme